MNNTNKRDKEFEDFMVFAIHEYAKKHIVLLSPRMRELFGEVIQT